jgi:hypothetical protein
MRIAALLILGLLTVAPTPAQRPRSLGDVRTLRLANIPPTAMNKALASQIQQSGVFEMMSNRTDPADAWLLPIDGCDTKTGEFLPEKRRLTSHGLCGVMLVDTSAKDANETPLEIWSGRFSRVPELYLEVARLKQSGQPVDIQEFVAKGVIDELLTDHRLAIEGKPQTAPQTLSLGQVKRIFVSAGDYSYEGPLDKLLEEEMRRRLAKWVEVKENGKKKRTLPPGEALPNISAPNSDWTAVESVLPGIRLVFYPALADAILVGPYTQSYAGPMIYTGRERATTTLNSDGTAADTDARVTLRGHQQIIEEGTATLFDRRTGETIWKATKTDSHLWFRADTGYAAVVENVIRQLKKDYEKAARGQ